MVVRVAAVEQRVRLCLQTGKRGEGATAAAARAGATSGARNGGDGDGRLRR